MCNQDRRRTGWGQAVEGCCRLGCDSSSLLSAWDLRLDGCLLGGVELLGHGADDAHQLQIKIALTLAPILTAICILISIVFNFAYHRLEDALSLSRGQWYHAHLGQLEDCAILHHLTHLPRIQLHVRDA